MLILDVNLWKGFAWGAGGQEETMYFVNILFGTFWPQNEVLWVIET